jgi:low temperature requirement protein LtrA
MRLALVAQWLRAAREDPGHRPTALRYAIGTALVQAGWVAWLVSGLDATLALFIPLAALELLVPIWGERAGATSWHPEHIIERYGLFTIIVLGESVLSASNAIQTIDDLSDISWEIGGIIAGGLLILFSLWWLYFGFRAEERPDSFRRLFIWGYGHYVLWAATAAVGAGLSVAVDYATDHAEIGEAIAGAAVAVPVAVYLIALWVIHDLSHPQKPVERWCTPLAAVVVLLTPFTGAATLVTGVILALLCAFRTATSMMDETTGEGIIPSPPSHPRG